MGDYKGILDEQFKLFSLSANQPLAEEISEGLGVELGKVHVETFSDGEMYINIEESIRGKSCYIIQPTSYPVNDHYMEIFIMADALRRASADHVCLVMPYYGYQRQDRTTRPRDPISAKVMANMLVRSGVDRMVTVDMHAPQLQGFTDIPMDHLTAAPVLARYFSDHYLKRDQATLVVTAHSGARRGRDYADHLDLPMSMMDQREDLSASDELHVIGNVKGKQCVIVDDLIDTGQTVARTSEALIREGAEEVYVLVTHPVFSEGAIGRLQAAPIEKVIVTNTIQLAEEDKFEKLEQVSIAPLLEEAIVRIYQSESIKPLYDYGHLDHDED